MPNKCHKNLQNMLISHQFQINPPAPKVLGRDLPDGTRKKVTGLPGGGIFRPKPPVFDRS